jgi:hypothetical protein
MRYVICNRELRRKVPSDAMILLSYASELSNIDLDALILSYMNMTKYEKKLYITELRKELNAYDTAA